MLGDFPRVVAQAAAPASSRTGWPATSRSSPAASTSWYDTCRVRPVSVDEEITDLHRTPAVAQRRHPPGARQRPRPARGQRPRADVRADRCVRTRPVSSTPRATAGPRSTCRTRRDVMELLPQLWPRSVGRDERRPADRRRRRRADPAPASTARAAYVLDEDDFRSRAAEFRDGFASAFEPLAGADVYYAGKAFLCTAVARWVAEEGLHLDVCTGGELAVARRARLPRAADRLPRQQQDHRRDPRGARATAWAGSSSTPSTRSTASPRSPKSSACVAPVMVRVTVGVEAHTHEFIATAHEDQKFGFSLGRRPGRSRRRPALLATARRVRPARPAQPHRQPDLRHRRLRDGGRAGWSACTPRSSTSTAIHCPEIDLGGGYGIAYTSQHTPLLGRRRSRRRWPTSSAASSRPSATATTPACPASRSSRAAPSSARAPSPSTRSARSRTSRSAAATPAPTSRSTAG